MDLIKKGKTRVKGLRLRMRHTNEAFINQVFWKPVCLLYAHPFVQKFYVKPFPPSIQCSKFGA